MKQVIQIYKNEMKNTVREKEKERERERKREFWKKILCLINTMYTMILYIYTMRLDLITV